MKSNTPIALTIGLLLGVAAIDAHAQAVYRCGRTYSQTPCGDGRIIEATDPRTAAQRAEARRMVADENRLADQMRRDRLAEEAAQRGIGPASLGGAPAGEAKHTDKSPTRAKKKRATPKTERSATFVALGAATPKGKKVQE